jgi:hypothetical protein
MPNTWCDSVDAESRCLRRKAAAELPHSRVFSSLHEPRLGVRPLFVSLAVDCKLLTVDCCYALV